MTTDPQIPAQPDPAAGQVSQQEYSGAAEMTVTPAEPPVDPAPPVPEPPSEPAPPAPDPPADPVPDISESTGILYVPMNADPQPYREDR